jgi:hypothetical protein
MFWITAWNFTTHSSSLFHKHLWVAEQFFITDSLEICCTWLAALLVRQRPSYPVQSFFFLHCAGDHVCSSYCPKMQS